MFRTQWRGLDKLRRVCGSESWIRYYRFSNVNRQGNEAFSTLDLALSDCIRGLLDDSESKCLLPSPLVERLSRVTSLNPASLSASDYIKLQKRNLTSAIISSPRPFASKKHYSDFSGAPFPSGTRGFFYAATHPTLPLATELRFRITDRASPKSFMLGRDMLNEDGFPWHIPLLALLSNDEFAPIVNRLEQDGLIPARADLLHRHREDRWAVERYNIEDDSEAADHRSILNLTAWPSDKPAVLYAFGQPFSYSFGETGFGKGHPEFLYLVSRTGVERLRTDEIFSISSMEMIVRTVMAARRRRPTEEDWLRPITIHEPPHDHGVFCLEPDPEGDGVVLRCLQLSPESFTSVSRPGRSHDRAQFLFCPQLSAGRLVKIAGIPFRLGRHTRASQAAHNMLENGETFRQLGKQVARAQNNKTARRSIKHTVHSLDPSGITASDYVELSRATCVLRSASSTAGAAHVSFSRNAAGEIIPFPNGTRGFFYCAHSGAHPPLAAELRFRVTHGATPEHFALGRDLSTSVGLPWSISLLHMLSQRSYASLIDLMGRQGVAEDEAKILALSRIANLSKAIGKPTVPSERARVIHSYKQPFVWKFDGLRPNFAMWSVSSEHVMRTTSSRLLVHLVSRAANIASEEDGATGIEELQIALPTSGSVLICFEQAYPTLGLRCLDVTKQLSYECRSFKRRPDGIWILTHPAGSAIDFPLGVFASGPSTLESPMCEVLDFTPGEMVRYRGRPVTIARGSWMYKWAHALLLNSYLK